MNSPHPPVAPEGAEPGPEDAGRLSGAIHPSTILGAWGLCAVALEWLAPTTMPAWGVLAAGGKALAAVGVSLFVWALFEFRRHRTTLEHRKPTTALVTRGPFTFSRNPVYVALISAMAGISIDYDSVWALILVVPMAVAMHILTVLREETYLERAFGDEYRAYRTRVRRWF